MTFIKVTNVSNNKESMIRVDIIQLIVDLGDHRRIWFGEQDNDYIDVQESINLIEKLLNKSIDH